jgi:hypothetical protein
MFFTKRVPGTVKGDSKFINISLTVSGTKIPGTASHVLERLCLRMTCAEDWMPPMFL